MATLMNAMGATKSRRLAGAIAFALTLGAAAIALAASSIVVIYTNDFSTKGRGHQLQGAGKHCNKRVNHGGLVVTVKSGPTDCAYVLPVEGDSRQPEQDLEARFKLRKLTPSHLRKHTYVGLRVRTQGKQSYELRIFPKTHRFALRRTPDGDNFPVGGNDGAIAPVEKWNTLQLRVFSHKVWAWVNGHKLAEVQDPKPGDLKGRKMRIVVADGKHTDKDSVVRVDDLRVAVPNP